MEETLIFYEFFFFFYNRLVGKMEALVENELLIAVNIVSRFSLWGEQQKIASRDQFF